MLNKYPISPPSSYVTAVAAGYADAEGNLVLVDAATPLPIAAVRGVAPEPLQGSATQSLVAGPFEPLADAPVHLELGGDWSGRVELHRSADGGTTRSPVTAGGQPWAQFESNVNEVIWQEAERGATLYLDIQLVSGTLSYRVSQ